MDTVFNAYACAHSTARRDGRKLAHHFFKCTSINFKWITSKMVQQLRRQLVLLLPCCLFVCLKNKQQSSKAENFVWKLKFIAWLVVNNGSHTANPLSIHMIRFAWVNGSQNNKFAHQCFTQSSYSMVFRTIGWERMARVGLRDCERIKISVWKNGQSWEQL